VSAYGSINDRKWGLGVHDSLDDVEQVHPVAGEYLGLTIERQVVVIFRDNGKVAYLRIASQGRSANSHAGWASCQMINAR
jgi:hypothetical protein